LVVDDVAPAVKLPSSLEGDGEVANGTITSAPEISQAFTLVDQFVSNRVQPCIDAKYGDEIGKSGGYVRYRVLAIETDLFESQLKGSFNDWDEGDIRSTISAPLFEGKTVEVTMHRWAVDANLGMRGGAASVGEPKILGSYARFSFTSEGELNGLINTGQATYLIEAVSEQPYYVVLETALLGLTPLSRTRLKRPIMAMEERHAK
jgi:hypothetical protein